MHQLLKAAYAAMVAGSTVRREIVEELNVRVFTTIR